mgnify:CR=1 FL=1
MVKFFKFLFRWGFIKRRGLKQMDDWSKHIIEIDQEFQSKLEALSMHQAAMAVDFECQFEEVERKHQQAMLKLSIQRQKLLQSSCKTSLSSYLIDENFTRNKVPK